MFIHKSHMRRANYDKYPSTVVEGTLYKGWQAITKAINERIDKSIFTIVLDTYSGVHYDEIRRAWASREDVLYIEASEFYKEERQIIDMTAQYITDDVLFGHLSPLHIVDYLDQEKVKAVRDRVASHDGLSVIAGTGAAEVIPNSDLLLFADMARWEIQQRFRKHAVVALGVDNSGDTPSLQYKRGYFNDWQVCDRHKRTLYDRVDYWIDMNMEGTPKMIDGITFNKGLKKCVQRPFRVVPFFDPAPWGGQWMKEVCDLNPETPNYGWCFDCVPEENSLFLNIGGELFEMPSINLIFTHPTELLGESITERFGAEFPIRFDFLDTVGGGNLSLQVHPTNEYIRETFGMPYTQDESYYLLDAGEGAEVYLGLKRGIEPQKMVDDLRRAAAGQGNFDAERYVNKFPAKKHDHYLIPAGTIHCSGAQALVLEISSTPSLFTFKLWDWGRLGLDGKPRPINVEHGKQVIDWSRDTDYAERHLVNRVVQIGRGDGWREESTGLHENEFIETRRHWFTKRVLHNTDGNLNVVNLVEGDQAVVESPTGAFEPFVVHYAETFIVPAHIGAYTITPCGMALGTECGTLKAYVRTPLNLQTHLRTSN